MPPYSYSLPSLGSDSIRLLRLMPNEDENAPIQCRLHHYPLQKLDKGTHLYEALSYVWGSSKTPQSVFIDTCDLPVTASLYQALSRLRDRTFERILWVDYICINQADEQEKEHQIQSMAKIYGQANRVIVYLGEAIDDSDQALEDIRVAAEAESISSLQSEEGQKAMLKLLERPWFRRIWVLQEVAAARRILIMCGSAEVNGYTFCSGVSKLELSYKAHANLHSLIRSVTYLIRGAIFRPRYTTSPSTGLSLGELMDMYHTHEASKRHDKVYALLVMSSDGPRAAGLSPDYTVSWKDLLQRLIEFIVFEEVLVETWDEREIAVIKGKGCILGQVSLVESDGARYDRQYVDIAFNNTSKSLEYEELYGTRWSLRASAKHIRQYDFVYLLQGAAKPAIIRKCKDHFAIVIIAVTILQSEPTESGYIERQEPLASTGSFSYDFLLVWKWEDFPEDLQYRAAAGYETLPEINSLVPEYLKTTSDKAARSCEVALVLRESEDLQEEAKRLQEAIKGCEELFGKENPRALGGMDNLALAYEKLALVYTSQEQWTNAEMEWTNAEDQFLRVIEIRKRVQGIDHQDTLNSIAGLALAYIDQRNSSPMWRGLVKSLTGRIRDNLQIREEEMAEVTRYFRKGLITLLLELKRDNIPVTEKVVKAAAENQEYSKEMMAALLDQRSNEVKITEEVVKAAAGNWWTGEDIMTLLLDQRGTEFKITEEVVKAAAGNWHTGEAIMTLLLDQRGTEFKITEEVVKAAARNQLGKYIMALLLDRRGTEVKITGEIIKEVAGNSRQGKVIMALLRKHKGDEVKIAEQELNVKSGLFLYPW